MNLFLLGSCRIHRPIRKSMDNGHCVLLNRIDPCWFMHTARAARQAVEIIQGEIDPPLELRDLIFETDNQRIIDFRAPDMIRGADALILEICTLSSIDLNGWEANAHRIWHANKEDDPRVRSAVKTMQTSEEIANDIRNISDMTQKPIMVVNHISITGIPELDSSRKILTDTLKDAAKMIDFVLFDTTIVLESVPRSIALKDHNHYTAEFETTLGSAMIAHLQSQFFTQ